MAYSLSIDGYEFDNPPEKYRKHLTLGNNPVPHYRKGLAQFYQSGQQEIQFEVEGRLSLNEQNDLDELEELQQIAIRGGEVEVAFDPFFSGTCIIEDDPFRQADELGYYRFILTVNSVSTDDTSYPSHATPTTGNTFKLGSFDFGYDPESVEENYERQTNTVDRLSGISQSIDTAGLVTKVTIDGNTDGAGQTALWDKARSNELSYLDAEFQKGWALIADVSVRNNENAPDYLKGLFQYSLDLLIVSNPSGGIGEVSSFIDHDVKDTGTYVSDGDSGDANFDGLEYEVSGGSGSLNDEYVEWSTTTLTLTDDATNWVYVTDDDSDGSGDVKYNNSGFPADSIHLYRVYTSGGTITKIEDLRSLLIQDNDADAGDFNSYKDNGDLYGTVATGTSPDDPNGKETTWPTVTNLLAYNATNYLFLEDPDTDGSGTISVNQSGYPADSVHIWRIVTDGSGITNKYDDRSGDLTTSGSGDTSNSDLVFSDNMVMDDTAFEFARVLALADSFDLGDAGTLPWKGFATLQDSIADIDDSSLLPGKGIAPLSDSINVEDGGTASGGGGGGTSEETLNWGKAADWDAGTDTRVVHEDFAGGDRQAGTVQLGYPSDLSDLHLYWHSDEESGSVAEDPAGGHDGEINGVSKGQTGVLGSTGFQYDGSTSDWIRYENYNDIPQTEFTIAYWIKTTSSGTGMLSYASSNNDNEMVFYKPEEFNVYVDGSQDTAGVSVNDGNLHFVVIRWRSSDGQWELDIDGQHQYTGTISSGGSVDSSGSAYIAQEQDSVSGGLDSSQATAGLFDEILWFSAYKSDSFVQNLYDTASSGTKITGWKTFSEQVSPDDLSLENVQAGLNGQSATVYVESDTDGDGAVNETSDAVNLDGSGGPYTVTGLSTSTDKYRLRIELSTGDVTATPTVSNVDLVASISGSGEPDQNENTHWTIRGGKFDRSGNEFEGGGVTTTFAGD